VYSLPPCRFQIGQRVRTSDNDAGVIRAVLYALTAPGSCWSRPGFTYFVQFDRPHLFEDSAHEDELVEES
jgi:hypothetical protein